MMKQKENTVLTIDLDGPNGNAFYLLGTAQQLAKQSGAAHNKLAEIMSLTAARAPRPASSPKYRETFAISLAMEQWRNSNPDIK